MTRAPLLAPAVRRLLVLAVVVAALGVGARAVGPAPGSSGALGAPGALGIALGSTAIVVAGLALLLLWSRRGFDRVERTPTIAASVIAVATALGTVGIVYLLNNGPDRPIGIIGSVAAVGIVVAASASAAATSLLIRPHVEAFAAHIWAGIGGAGLAVPFMVAGVPPEVVMAGAVGMGVLDRRGHVRQRAELEQREARLRGEPVLERTRWNATERRRAVLSGAVAIGLVVVAWGGGVALASLAGRPDGIGQGFAVASLAAAPLALQAAMLSGRVERVRGILIACGGMLAVATLAIVVAPVDAVFFAALGLQSVAVALLAGALATRRAPSGSAGEGEAATVERALTAALLAAVGWWLLVVPTGGLALGVLAVGTTITAASRRAARCVT